MKLVLNICTNNSELSIFLQAEFKISFNDRVVDLSAQITHLRHQKQPPKVFYKKSFSQNFRNILRLSPFLIKLQAFRPLLQRGSQTVVLL